MRLYEIVLTVIGAGGLIVLAVWGLLEWMGCFEVEERCDCKGCVRDRGDRNPFDVDEFDPIQPEVK